jgi:hypothetical protein
VRELLQRECAAAGVVLNVVAETDAVNAQKALVMGGTGSQFCRDQWFSRK